jgi:citrate/tricarballylate utilization protein
MLSGDLVQHGHHVMTVCNACRYCEGYCPVFPAVEHRLTFAKGDLAYLANLCHDCGECLYACQYAPPHEFGINVPRMMDGIRVASYEEYCWPRFLSGAFTHQRLTTMVSLAAGLIAVLLAKGSSRGGVYAGDFYLVVPHDVMVTLFAAVALFVVTALVIGRARFLRGIAEDTVPVVQASRPARETNLRFRMTTAARAFCDGLTLKHLHTGGVDCTLAEEARAPWRRWFHHATFYGFVLCFASTTVAAIYHVVFGWRAPYGYTSLPVVLGTIGGAGLLIGPSGLLALRRHRDPDRDGADRSALDTSFIALLFLTSLTGLLLLALREGPAMAALLIVHLAFVIALFLTLPYGKFVHGIYRTAALVKYTRERSTWTS